EPMQPGALHRADVNEDVVSAVVRLNKAVSLLTVEPLHSSRIHGSFPSNACCRAAPGARRLSSRSGEKVVSQARRGAARPSRSAETRSLQHGNAGSLWQG